MSKIAPLIKQAFGTSNAHEAASFLASAINRMKGFDKPQITKEVEAALQGVNFTRTAEAPKAKPQTRTVYKDTPETERRLQSYIRQVADLQREIDALNANRADPAEIKRLTARVDALTKEAAARERQHLEELAMTRANVKQNTGEAEQLRQQVEELTGRIDRLKFALAEMASGNDGETVLRQAAERRLESALSDLKRAQEAYSEAEAKRQALQRQLKDADALASTLNAENNELSSLVESAGVSIDALEAERSKLSFTMRQQQSQHAADLKEEQDKRKAAARRADDAELAHTHTKTRLKFEEQNSMNWYNKYQRQAAELKQKAELADMHEENARHLYYQTKSLEAALALQTAENERLKSTVLGGYLLKTPTALASVVGVGVANLSGYEGQQTALCIFATFCAVVTYYIAKAFSKIKQ